LENICGALVPDEVVAVAEKANFGLLLDGLEHVNYRSNVVHNITVIAHEMGRLVARCQELQDANPPDVAKDIIDAEMDLIESLLGISFVACQSYISSVIRAVRNLHEACRSLTPPVSLKTTSDRKSDIIRACSREVGGTGYSEIQVIDAFANYYKHKDEWAWDWNSPPEISKSTVSIIKSLGGSRGDTGNMRGAAEALGSDDTWDPQVFVKTLEEWGQELFRAYRGELREKGLLPSKA
jgi:hypothetical protein